MCIYLHLYQIYMYIFSTKHLASTYAISSFHHCLDLEKKAQYPKRLKSLVFHATDKLFVAQDKHFESPKLKAQ